MMRQATDAVLEEAIHLLQIGWCQDQLARDAAGEWADPDSVTATSWCATGAIMGAIGRLGREDPDERHYLRAVRRVARVAGCEDDDWLLPVDAALMRWNDERHTAEEVVLAFQRALAG